MKRAGDEVDDDDEKDSRPLKSYGEDESVEEVGNNNDWTASTAADWMGVDNKGRDTVDFPKVPWKVLNSWLSELNGNPNVACSLPNTVTSGDVIEG